MTDLGLAPCLDLLVVDVEGMEDEVFAGFSLEKWKPKAIIVELADLHPDLKTTRRADHNIGRRIKDAGYDIIYKDHINTFFVQTGLWERRLESAEF